MLFLVWNSQNQPNTCWWISYKNWCEQNDDGKLWLGSILSYIMTTESNWPTKEQFYTVNSTKKKNYFLSENLAQSRSGFIKGEVQVHWHPNQSSLVHLWPTDSENFLKFIQSKLNAPKYIIYVGNAPKTFLISKSAFITHVFSYIKFVCGRGGSRIFSRRGGGF